MAATEAAADSGPRYAPDDPTLPAPWKGLIDGSTLYYWNPDTNETQYERPLAAVPPLPTGPPPVTSTPMPTSASGDFSQPSMQLNQASQQERPGYPQASHLGQQQLQQPTQQPPFQPTAQHQAPFQHSQRAPYQQQHQQMSQQPPAHQYPSTHTQHMPYQHGHYMQSQQQQQLQQGPQYSYQVGQQQQMPQTAYNQGQQPPISQAAYNHSQQPAQAAGAYSQGQQPPVSQATYNQSQQPTQAASAYNQGQQPSMPQASYNQVQPPQMPHTTYNQGQQPPGMRIPHGQVQPQQSPGFHQPAQVSQVLQGSQSQGLQMPSQQGQLQHGFHLTTPQGKQPHHGHVGPQLSQVSLGQQGSTLKVDETGVTGGLDGKQTGFSLPLSQQRGQGPVLKQQLPSNHQLPGSHNQPNIPGAGGPSYPAKHHLGGSSPAETNNMNFLSSPAQMHQGGMDINYRQHPASGPVVPNHIGPSPVRPPMGFKMGSSEDHFERNELYPSGRMDGTNNLQQQPKLAALPPLNRPQDMRNGPPYPQPDNLGAFNMGPPHSVPNLHNHGPFPEASMRPPSRMFAPPNFPSIASADAYRQHHEVTAVGENVPPPFMTFEATGFPPEILQEIHAAGFLNPTPIQAQTWPVALQNRDIVAIAKTGSGKTLGYLIPAFIHLRRYQNNPMLGPTVLVLAPTRELASQIQDEAVKFGRSSRVSCTCLYGGTSKGLQLRELERGADIVVATPGRLNDILEMRKISLHQVSFLVLDEADRMLDMGFEPQIRKIVDEIPRNRQTLMYTATWPKEVTKIAGDLLKDPVQVNIGSIDELVANKSITQYVEVVPPLDKQRRLEQILRAQERGSKVIIFCSTKKMCDQLARDIGRSFGAASIHGDKSQAERDNVLNQFRTGRAPVLVATDVAARGLDIKDIRVVINYDFPTGIEDYVHRIGRTGRAGATGVSYTFFSEQDWKYAGDLVKVLEGANQHVPPELQEMAARGAAGAPRNQAGGMSRWDGPGGGGNRFESAVGVPGSYGGLRDGPGSFGGRDGPGGFGGRDGPGGFIGREGPGGFGGREGPVGFGGQEGPGGFGGRKGPGAFEGREGAAPGSFGGRGGRGPGGFGGRGGGNPGGFGGRGGRGDSPGFGGRGRGDFSGFGGRGRGDSSGFGGRGRGDFSGGRGGRGRGFGGRGRSDRGPHDRFISDGRGRLGASPAKSPGARVPGVIPKPINLPSQRGTATQGDKPMPSASNAWGSPSLMYPKHDGGSDSFSHISDRPSSRGSSTTSTIGSDFLDIPSVWGPKSSHSSVSRVFPPNHLPAAAHHLQSTETIARSSRPSRFPDSFTQVLKAPLRTNNRKRGLKMPEKGFTLIMDDFPVLGSVNSESNTRRGHNLQGRSTFGSGTQMAQDEQRKIHLTGVGEVISSSNYEHEHDLRTDYVYEGDAQVTAAILPWGAKHAKQHGTNAPKQSVPPPWFNYWHPPPDHPPDGNEMLHEGATLYGSDKPADSHMICSVEPLAYYGHFLLNQEAAPMQGPGYGGYISDNQDGYHCDMEADAVVIIQPHILGKVKHGHSEGLQKQPLIKKDVALLEKIKCLNIKARKLRAYKISELSSSKESMIEHSKNTDEKADHVKKDVPFSAITSDTMSAFDSASSFSESSDFVPSSPANVPGTTTITSSSEVEATEFRKAGEPGKLGDHDAYGRVSTSRSRHDDSAKNMSSSISKNGWEEHSTVDSLQVVMANAQQDKSFSRNVSLQVHVAAVDEMLNLLDNEIQLHSRTRELSAHHANQVLEEQDWISQQKAKSITELDELIRHSPEQSQKINDAPLEEDNLHLRQKDGSHGTTTHCIASSESFNAPLPANRVNHITDSISFTPASNTTGISQDPVIHKVISPAKNTEINMMETAPKSTSQSQDNSAPKHWKIDNRQRHVESWERITMERSNIAEKAEYVKNIAETPTDAPCAEAQCHEDLSTGDKNSWRDASAATTASRPVFDKNATKVPSAHKTLAGVVISNSMIPTHVTSVSGLTVGSIMLGDISFISVNQVGATAAREIHDTKNSHSRTTPIQQPNKKEQPEEGALNNMAVAAPTLLSGNHSIVQESAMIAEWSEMKKHKSVEKEQLNQWNLGRMLPAESHRASYGNPGTFNFGTESCDNGALDNFTASKAEVTTELDKWLDRESSWLQTKTGQQYTDGSVSVLQHFTEQVDKIDQWQSLEPDKQINRQLEFKTHDGSDNRSEPAHTAPLPVNNWEIHHASYSQRQNHVEGQRNVRSNDATNIYKEGRDRTCAFYEVPSLSKSFSHPQSNPQDTVVSEWMQDPYQGVYNMDNSRGFDSAFVDSNCNELIQNVDGDGEMDLYSGQFKEQVKFEDGHLLIWNPREWEYQLPSPPPHGQHSGSAMEICSEQIEGDVIWEDGHPLIWNPRDWEYQPLNLEPHHHDHGQHKGSEMVLYSEQIEGDMVQDDGHPLISNPKDWEYKQLNPELNQHDHGQHRRSAMVLYSEQIEGDVIWEDGHPLIWNPTDWEYQPLNPEPHHLDHGQHRRSEIDLYSEQVEGDMIWEDGCTLIWNPREWEYQPLNPAPHHHDQHSRRYHRGGDTYSEWGYDAREPTYGANEGRRKGGIHSEYQSKSVGSSDVAPDIQLNAGADDQSRRRPASGAAYRERRYYI
uniref:RNA helicase n=1 Tax=Oryza punctata TaxID=4537 RepID=A0A0E0MIA1_ORYPU